MCHKLLQVCILDIALILTSSLQVSYYCPHFKDEKMRHRKCKQNVHDRIAGKQC